jgi:hypothetical protein
MLNCLLVMGLKKLYQYNLWMCIKYATKVAICLFTEISVL